MFAIFGIALSVRWVGRGNEAAHGGKLRDDGGLEGIRLSKREGEDVAQREDPLDHCGRVRVERVRGADRGVKPVGERIVERRPAGLEGRGDEEDPRRDDEGEAGRQLLPRRGGPPPCRGCGWAASAIRPSPPDGSCGRAPDWRTGPAPRRGTASDRIRPASRGWAGCRRRGCDGPCFAGRGRSPRRRWSRIR